LVIFLIIKECTVQETKHNYYLLLTAQPCKGAPLGYLFNTSPGNIFKKLPANGANLEMYRYKE
jgi:hypothetical protein